MSIADAMEEPTATEFILSEALQRSSENFDNLLAQLRDFADKQLVETGFYDRAYKNPAPYDAGKRAAAMELIKFLDNFPK